MKIKPNSHHLIFTVIILFWVACNNVTKNKTEASDAQQAAVGEGQILEVDIFASTINWKGFKPGGEHTGTLAMKSGSITIQDNEVKEGYFVLDMAGIKNLDLTDPAMNEKLVGHLKSSDFFDVEKYPTGKFTITKVEQIQSDQANFRISGNLKLKDVEKNISFDAHISKNGNIYTAKTVPFTINRTQWGVNYGSKSIFDNLKDKFISDDIEIQITIVTKASK